MVELLPPASPSRRAVVGAAAWSVPAIAVATASPAFAASGPSALEFIRGATFVEGVPYDGDECYDLVFDGASVLATGPAAPAPVTMTVTFTPFQTSPIATGQLHPFGIPSGWSGDDPPDVVAVTYTFGAGISESSPAPIPNGRYFGSNWAREVGTFTLTFTAAGYEPVTVGFDTPGAAPFARLAPGATAGVGDSGSGGGRGSA